MQSRCPHCSTASEVDNGQAGRPVTCATCRRVYVALAMDSAREGLSLVPEAGTAAPPPGQTVRHVAARNRRLDESAAVTVADLGIELAPIQPGRFVRGSDRGYGNEAPKHIVTLSDPFWMARTPVTQEQWLAVMLANPSYFAGPRHPVETVSWAEALEFCRRLTERERCANRLPDTAFFRLPTEAEWEYVCRTTPQARGGAAGEGAWRHLSESSEYGFGDAPEQLDAYGWYAGNSDGTTHPVGLKKANPWGIWDLHGNVGEWCMDWYDTYTTKDVANPTGPPSGGRKVRRGGAWCSLATRCRAANRIGVSPECACAIVGFRVVLVCTGVCPYEGSTRVW
ncbi:MAG: Serine/threonine-protein kinase pkn1 [Lentisphaerae bacterium ADurb.BinA184]|nr:MAG: Serine/threonine-protein kinase pkn1 [Lentisphaerae bacterium ADurb.BinA184]